MKRTNPFQGLENEAPLRMLSGSVSSLSVPSDAGGMGCLSGGNIMCFGGNGGNGSIKMRRRPANNRRHPETTSDTDALMAKEMTQLSFKEREQALNDLHGVPDAVEETPEFVDECLAKMEEEISFIRKRVAYDKALFLNPKYVQDRSFRLMFLRADRFHPGKAANRIVQHFEFKLELFGYEKLGKKITFDDLDEFDQESVMSASVWFLEEYDQAGRRILLVTVDKTTYKTAMNSFRATWYLFMAALEEDKQMQRNGIVDILYNAGARNLNPNYKHDTDLILKSQSLWVSLPFRFVGVHFCYDGRQSPVVMGLLQMALGMSNRVRFRAHHGSTMELKYALIGYGIPELSLPFNAAGKLEHSEFYRYIRQRQELEQRREAGESVAGLNGTRSPLSISSEESQVKVVCPTKFDVLLGRGRPYQDFPGNVRLAKVVDIHKEYYESVKDRFEKTALTREVVRIIKEMGGRFLKRGDDGWEEVEDEVAREKVSNSFRTSMRLRGRVHKNKTTIATTSTATKTAIALNTERG